MRATRAQWSAGAAGPVLAAVPDLDCGPAGPGPLAWQDRASCAQSDPEAWFPEKGGSSAIAKAICYRCPVLGECLDFIMRPENADACRFGIWAGLSERERRRLRQESLQPAQPPAGWRNCDHQRVPGERECSTCRSARESKYREQKKAAA